MDRYLLHLRTGLLASVLVLGQGCGTATRLVPVTGKVELDGNPLAGAVIAFIPTGDTLGTGASGRTEADGRYQLQTRQGKGVMPGTYKVTISRWLRPDGSDPLPDVPPIESDAREILPPRYSNAEETVLTAVVPENGATIGFPLTLRGP